LNVIILHFLQTGYIFTLELRVRASWIRPSVFDNNNKDDGRMNEYSSSRRFLEQRGRCGRGLWLIDSKYLLVLTRCRALTNHDNFWELAARRARSIVDASCNWRT